MPSRGRAGKREVCRQPPGLQRGSSFRTLRPGQRRGEALRDIYCWKAAPLPLPEHDGELEPVWETFLFRKGFSQSGGTALPNIPEARGGFVRN